MKVWLARLSDYSMADRKTVCINVVCVIFDLSPHSSAWPYHGLTIHESIKSALTIPYTPVFMEHIQLSYTMFAKYTVEPPNKGHAQTRSLVLYREVFFIWNLKCSDVIKIGTSNFIERCPLFRVSFIGGSIMFHLHRACPIKNCL